MKQRIELIDSLRGFSLFGILLANLLIFQYGLIGKDYLNELSIIDTVGYYFTKIFIETSSMPIFTFLFGYSLIKFVESIKKRQPKTRWVLIRRAIGLLVIGFLHGAFLWEGDILFFYGEISFFLLFFIYRKPKTLFISAGILFGILFLTSYEPEFKLDESNKVETYLQQESSIMRTGTYKEILDFRLKNELSRNEDVEHESLLSFILTFFTHFFLEPMILIGMACAKIKFFSSPDIEHSVYKKLTMLLFLGILLKSIAQFESNFSSMLYTLGGPLLSIGYIGAFTLFYHSTIDSKYKKAFAAVGKLSLSNYLFQSCIFTFIFYGYGLGFFVTWASRLLSF